MPDQTPIVAWADVDTAVVQASVTGDAYPRFEILADGRIRWGSGSVAPDTTFYRAEPSVLRTEDVLEIKRATATIALRFRLATDTDNSRLYVLANGEMWWGPGGAVATDTYLYRSSAGTLTVSGIQSDGWKSPFIAFRAGLPNNGYVGYAQYISTDTEPVFRVSGSGAIEWGPGGSTVTDTNLVREAAGILSTTDSVRDRHLMDTGYVPHAFAIGYDPALTVTTSVGLAVSGGTVAVPIIAPGHMLIERLAFRNNDAAGAHTLEWRLYQDHKNSSNTINEVAGANGTFTYTPGAASNVISAAASAPVYIGPGTYWCLIRNTSASVTANIGTLAAGTMGTSLAQTKTLGSALGSTIDLVAATWTKSTSIFGIILQGRVNGQTITF